MAANPLIAKLAHDVAGVNLTWTSWAVAAIVPGLVSLIITPLVIYKLYPPEVKETPDAAKIATEKLKEMGPFKNRNSRWSRSFCSSFFMDFRRKPEN